MKVNLTALESEILKKLQRESLFNGHDFGVVSNVQWNNPMQLGGVLSSLFRKGVIVDISPVSIIGEGEITQFVLADEYKRANKD